MKKSGLYLGLVWALTLWLGAPLVAGQDQPEPEAPVLAAPDIDPWEWFLPKRKNQSCQPLTTCACVPDTSSAWCIQSGLSCKDDNGMECQWPPRGEDPIVAEER